MKIAGDTHTHTLICQHAYSTLLENIREAAALGHRFIAATEHGPAMKGAPYEWFFGNMRKAVPREVEGVVVIRGCETNVLDREGNLDISPDILDKLDMVIASIHPSTFLPGTAHTSEDRTSAWLHVAANPRVDIIGHLGDPRFSMDYEKVIRAFRGKREGGGAERILPGEPPRLGGELPDRRPALPGDGGAGGPLQ